MKRVILFLCLNLYPAITLLAEKDYSTYGRDYIEREDSPFISPIELIGSIILIVGGYWALRGICSVLDNMGNILKGEKKGEVSNKIKNNNTP